MDKNYAAMYKDLLNFALHFCFIDICYICVRKFSARGKESAC